MQFAGLWSLNHYLTTSFGLCHTPNFPKIHIYLQLGSISVIRAILFFPVLHHLTRCTLFV